MRKPISILLCAAFAAAFSLNAAARPGGAGSGNTFTHGTPIGPGAGSKSGANSNGRFSADRDKGQERAADRRSARSRAHHNAGMADKKRHHGTTNKPVKPTPLPKAPAPVPAPPPLPK